MRKILLGALITTGASAFALNNSAFQEFDNQYNAGYSLTQYTLSNGAGNQMLQQNQAMNLEVERLFDAGVWLNVNANLVTATNSLGNQANGTGMGNNQMPLTQVPNLGGVNAKVGYAFPLITNHLQLTPYALAGRNTNATMSTVIANGYSNISNDYFYTGGIGARLEYRINKYIYLYADQAVAYNWDQSAPQGGLMPQNMMAYTSTLGAKFNVVKNLQLGVNGFYNNFQYMAAAPYQSGTIMGGNNNVSAYQPQYNIGGMVTVGLTY